MRKPSANRAVKDLEPMVRKFAGQWVRQHHGIYEDLVQQGFLGVLEAHKRFKEESNTKFSSYAWFYIRKYIREYTLGQWNHMNNTTNCDSDVTTYVIDQKYSTAIDEDMIDLKRKLEKLDKRAQTIYLMKQEGYTLDEIADKLVKLGLTPKKHSLESIRVQLTKISENI